MTPCRDGTTQVAFEPVDFVARLAALVPKPRVNLTRYHGVLAPNALSVLTTSSIQVFDFLNSFQTSIYPFSKLDRFPYFG
jgi:hypothetical protein